TQPARASATTLRGSEYRVPGSRFRVPGSGCRVPGFRESRIPNPESRVNGTMPGNDDRELLNVAGHELAISTPGQVLFPQAGYTKLDLARYYLAVSDGALRAAGGRPNVLVRYPNGIDGEFFYQKRAPQSRPAWIDVVQLSFPSGRTAEEVVPRDA